MNTILKASNISKVYKHTTAVNQLSMTIQKGDIYGFIGKNGAGKTTLIRMIAGLAKPSSGTLALFESEDLIPQRSKLGTVIENPALFPSMTARENLMVQCKLLGITDLSCIEDYLRLVDLPDTNKKKTKDFSLGMKQRLAIAIALVGEPDFLILDEPTNGLDPEGIKEIRELIITLNQKHGITILISSHILSELSKFATRYGIIHNGVLIEEFTSAELVDRCRQEDGRFMDLEEYFLKVIGGQAHEKSY